MSELTVKTVTFADILAADDLIKEYSAECSIPEIGATNPQRGMYAQMESSGMMHTFAVYADKTLAGFATVLTYILPHYGKKVAAMESLFVGSTYRENGAGLKLMKAVEDYAQQSGCAVLLYSAPAGGTLEKLLSARKGCRHTNSVFTRSFA